MWLKSSFDLQVLPWELPEDEYDRRYWIDRFLEYAAVEKSPKVKKYRERRSKGKSAEKRGQARGLTVEDGGKD